MTWPNDAGGDLSEHQINLLTYFPFARSIDVNCHVVSNSSTKDQIRDATMLALHSGRLEALCWSETLDHPNAVLPVLLNNIVNLQPNHLANMMSLSIDCSIDYTEVTIDWSGLRHCHHLESLTLSRFIERLHLNPEQAHPMQLIFGNLPNSITVLKCNSIMEHRSAEVPQYLLNHLNEKLKCSSFLPHLR